MPSQRLKLAFAHWSDSGRVRTFNEDSVVVDAALGLALVADGMGGHNAGEVASQMAAEVINSCIAAHVAEHGLTTLHAAAVRQALLRRAVSLANLQIVDAAANNPAWSGMGTTLVLALFGDAEVTIAHVGDSRAYRLRDGVLEQLTRDHSSGQQAIDVRDVHLLSEVTMREPKHRLTRAVGVMSYVELEMREEIVAEGDRVLLCSDGLYDCFSQQTLKHLLQHAEDDLGAQCDALLGAANPQNGEDNISVIRINVRVNGPFNFPMLPSWLRQRYARWKTRWKRLVAK